MECDAEVMTIEADEIHVGDVIEVVDVVNVVEVIEAVAMSYAIYT